MDELSAALTEFRETGSQAAFEALYAMTRKIRSYHTFRLRSMGIGDDSDALEVFDDTLLNVIKRPVTEGFSAYLSGALRYARINFARKQNKHRSRTAYVDDDSDANARGMPTPELFIDRTTPEVLYLEAERKKRAASVCAALLTDPDSGLSPRMTAIIADLPNHRTINRLADANGIHHSYIFRSLAKLARCYVSNRHGDYRDII